MITCQSTIKYVCILELYCEAIGRMRSVEWYHNGKKLSVGKWKGKIGNVPCLPLLTGFSLKLVFNLAEKPHIKLIGPPTVPWWDLNPGLLKLELLASRSIPSFVCLLWSHSPLHLQTMFIVSPLNIYKWCLFIMCPLHIIQLSVTRYAR